MPKNKYLIAAAGMTIQLSIGSVYAYSIWVEPINKALGWDAHLLKNAFILAICFLGLSAAFLGRFVEKIGPMKAGMLAAIFYGLGLIGAGFAVYVQSIIGFYLFFGVISGIGLGLGYITPVGTVLKWFPEKPGFASGLIIMSFAFGSIIASQVITPLTRNFGLSNTFYILGSVYFTFMLLAALYLESPKNTNDQKPIGENQLEPKKFNILKQSMFYGLWLLLFLNTVCGIAIISKAAILGKDYANLDSNHVILFVGLIGLSNGLGRLFWSSISDKIGRWNTFMTFFSIELVCFAALAFTTNTILFQLLVFLIISCYGGAFATIPAFIKDIFGVANLGPVLGYVLTAWAAAGIVGPILISISDKPNIFLVFSGIIGIAIIVAMAMKRKIAI
jgi:OFA family oxalate/formate antiporter-like MFS transporter